MSKITFNEYFGGVSGLAAGEKREAKGLLRYAFVSGRRKDGLKNAMDGNPQWAALAEPSQQAMSQHVAAAYRAGEAP